MCYVEPELLYGFSFLALFAKKILCHLYNCKHSNPRCKVYKTSTNTTTWLPHYRGIQEYFFVVAFDLFLMEFLQSISIPVANL